MDDDCGCGCNDCNDQPTTSSNTNNTVQLATGRSKLVRKYKAQTSNVFNAVKKIVNQSLNTNANGG